MQESNIDTTVRRIGKYEVTGELGHGGMAVVYRARDTTLLRDVAVKVLHPHLANDPESRRRFRREAQAAARLRHPHIVEVFDFSGEDDRESFMVSELLEGPTLRRFAEQHPGMPAEVAAAVGVVLCEALACAHGQGVVHRDVKPDNILLQKGGVLKLTDFGIAHVSDSGQMTVTGQVLGSPAHMAPEQIEGRSVDPRTDLFAVGTVLYVLAVGRLPFEAPHPHALLRKILETDYPDPLRVAPGVGHRFADIVHKCLARDVADRWQDALALRSALLAFIAEAGWDGADVPLQRYLEAPESFATAHRQVLLAKLPELGVAARRDGRVTDALGYFNRALALEPGNAKVLGLVRGIARKRRVRRATRAVLIVATAAASSALVVVIAARHGASHPTHADPVHRVVQRPALERTNGSTGPQSAGPTGPLHDVAAAPREPVHPSNATLQHALRPSVRPVALTHPVHVEPPPLVNVVLSINPQGVRYSIDGASLEEYGTALRLRLAVGTHQIRIEPNAPSCQSFNETWTIDPTTPPTRRINLSCRTTERPTDDSAVARP